MALVFLTSGAYDMYLNQLIDKGAPMALWAFENNLGMFGKIIFTIILPLFAFTTVLSWEFYGECGIKYLFGNKAILPFKIVYVLLVVAGATLKIDIVWNLSDSFNVLMAVPNLIALILLSGVLKRVVNNYIKRRKDSTIKPMLSVYEKHNEELINELYIEKNIIADELE